MKRIVLFALLTGAALLAGARIGDRPPEIRFDKLLPEQPVSNAGFDSFTGKVVVLELWATWCGPCINAIPHWNELADHFKDQPIVFLSVSDEEPAVVEKFLKDKPIKGLVGIAHSESSLAAYGVNAIPATFLIDKSGRIVGSTDPNRLTVSMLDDLLMGQGLPSIELTIRRHDRATPTSFSSIIMRNSLTMTTRLDSLISRFWGVRHDRISGDALDDKTSYDITLHAPTADAETFEQRVRDIVATSFHITVTRETRNTEVWVLTKTPTNPPALKPGGSIKDMTPMWFIAATPPARGRVMQMSYCEVSFISQLFEAAVKRPVVDETGIAGRFDIQIPVENEDPQAVVEAIRKAGFNIEAQRRAIDFLIVNKVK